MKMLLVLGGLLLAVALLVGLQGRTTAYAQTHTPLLLVAGE